MQQLAISIHFGAYLKKLIKQHGLSVAHLADAADLPTRIIEQLIAGDQILTGDLAFLLADYFKISPLELIRVQSSYYQSVREKPNEKDALAA